MSSTAMIRLGSMYLSGSSGSAAAQNAHSEFSIWRGVPNLLELHRLLGTNRLR